MKDTGVSEKAQVKGVIDKMHSQRCSNDSYRRSFIVRYNDHYTNKEGKRVFVDMYQNVECFNEIARLIRADYKDGDTVILTGRLKSRETEYGAIHFIEVEELEDIRNISSVMRGW